MSKELDEQLLINKEMAKTIGKYEFMIKDFREWLEKDLMNYYSNDSHLVNYYFNNSHLDRKQFHERIRKIIKKLDELFEVEK